MTAHHSRIERRLSASRRAGYLRVVFAVAALCFARGVFPNRPAAEFVYAVYLLLSLTFQAVIARGLAASDLRSFTMGAVDVGFLSYAVYLLGPASSVLPFVYLLIPVVNAASSSSRSHVAMRLALLSATVYVGLLSSAFFQLIPYAPAAKAVMEVPELPHLIAAGTLVVFSVLSTTNIVLRQMSALDRANKRLSELSNLDELTGLCNRRQLLAELQRQLERVARGASCAIMMLDLDGFKRVNDSLGHEAGDLLLIDLASTLSAETRSIDVVARYGGDEFIIVLPDVDGEHAVPIAQRIVDAVAHVGRERLPHTPVTASAGVTLMRPDDDIGALLRRADAEAYTAKRAGGNRIAVNMERAPASSGVVSATERRRALRP